MKSSIGFVLLVLSVNAYSASSLTIQLEARDLSPKDSWKIIKLSSLNPQLKKLNLPLFPEAVTLTAKDGKVWEKLVLQVETVSKAIKKELEILPDSNFVWGSKMCYSGPVADVFKTIEGLTGSMIDEDMGIYGYRIGKKTVFTYEGEFLDSEERRSEFTDAYPAEVDAWDSYSTTSDTLLLATNYGPSGDGTELNLTYVKKCK